MFWKIVFVLFSIGLFVTGYISAGADTHVDLSDINNIRGVIIVFILAAMFCLFTILYGLARRIRTFSIKTVKIFLITLVLLNVANALYYTLQANIPQFNSAFQYFAYFEILTLFFMFITLPLYIPLIIYKNFYFKYERQMKNLIFDLFALCWFIFAVFPPFCKEIYLTLISQMDYNIGENILFFICSMITIACYTGFILRKRFFNGNLLKCICMLAVLLDTVGVTKTAWEDYILSFTEAPITLKFLLCFCLIMSAVLIPYRYLFTNMTESADYIKTETLDVKVENPVIKEIKSKKEVSKGLYILLIIILGACGVHKFYAGKFLLGTIYLLFTWTYIPCVISVIELIMACRQKPNDENKILV